VTQKNSVISFDSGTTSYRSSHKGSLCLTSELDYPGTNGIETSYPFWSMSLSLRFGTPTDNTFKVKKIPCPATTKEEEHTLMLTAKLRLVQNPFKNVLRIYQLKKSIFCTIVMQCSGLRNTTYERFQASAAG